MNFHIYIYFVYFIFLQWEYEDEITVLYLSKEFLNSCEDSLCDTDYSVLLDRYNENTNGNLIKSDKNNIDDKDINVLPSSSAITDTNDGSDNESVNSKNSNMKMKKNSPMKEKKTISKKLKKIFTPVLKIKKTQYGLTYKDKDIIVNRQIFNQLGYRKFMEKFLYLFENDNIIVGMGMVSNSAELESSERTNATCWLDLWDDGSDHYGLLRKRGIERSSSSYD